MNGVRKICHYFAKRRTFAQAPAAHTFRKFISRAAIVSADNVIPFRKRPPSGKEMDVYREMTRRWPDASKQFLLPEHFAVELNEREEADLTMT